MRVFATTQRSRLPVYEGTLDHILGFVHIKDMIWILLERTRRAEEHSRPEPFFLRHLLRDALIVPETKPLSELLLEFRSRRTELAMVVDEFGSILGLATLEDILEQMVGEIHDEFDVVERPMVLPDGGMIFDGAVNVRELETQHNIALPEDSSYETIGGFVLSKLGFIPRGGESFEAVGYRFTVMEMDGRRISRVKIKPIRTAAVPLSEPGVGETKPSELPPVVAESDASLAAPPPKPRRARKAKAKAKPKAEAEGAEPEAHPEQ
jgi:putative hemolysin